MAGKPGTWARGQKRVTLVDLSDGSTAEGVAIVDAAGAQVTSFGGGTGAVTIADGADVAQGATSDASSATTVIGLLKAVKAAITGTLTVSSAAPTGIVAFLTTVTTAATRVQLASHTGLQGAVLEAPSTNTGIVYVGGSDVSATVYGAQLQPGQSVGVALSNTNLIYIDAATNGDKVACLGS